MNYFLAPRSTEKTDNNFSTIVNGVPYENIRDQLSDEGRRKVLQQEVIYAWGNRAGTKSTWENMETGDKVIFYKSGMFILVGEVYFKQHSSALSLKLWQADENGKPWEYVYFLRNLEYVQIPIEAFRRIAGYEPKFVVQKSMPLTAKYVDNIEKIYGTVENLLNTFKTSHSEEMPAANDTVFVNTEEDVQPEVRSESRLKPKEEKSSAPYLRGKSKIDFLAKNRNQAITGGKGESLVLAYEQSRLSDAGRQDLADKVIRVSAEDDGAGYDIKSYNDDGTDRYVEVKTSAKKSAGVRFFMSANEMKKSKELNSYYIYYVDSINSKRPRIMPISCPINEKLTISTDTYLVEAETT
jgi:hypothetical protein